MMRIKDFVFLVTHYAVFIRVVCICVCAIQAFLLTGCNLRGSDEIGLTQTQLPLGQGEGSANPTSVILTNATPIPFTTNTGIFSAEVVAHLQSVYAVGQSRGNRPQVFAKVGDSITVSTHFLTPFGDGNYNISDYPYLQPVIEYFLGGSLQQGNPFNRRSLAAGEGWGAWAVLTPTYSDRAACSPNEIPLLCEYRLIQPMFALIMFGTNDSGYRLNEEYRRDLEQIVALSEERGVIPILSTIPPRPGYENKTAALNTIVREITTAHHLPLWDYGAAMAQLPNYGLTNDLVHPSSPPGGNSAAAYFVGNNMNYGYTLRNLTALHILDAVWRTVQPLNQ